MVEGRLLLLLLLLLYYYHYYYFGEIHINNEVLISKSNRHIITSHMGPLYSLALKDIKFGHSQRLMI